MKRALVTVIGTLLILASTAKADEKYNHFPSLDSPDTATALCNLAKFNEKLKVIETKKSMTAEDMVKVHELTYTLENAVIRLQKDLDTIAVDLEKVHKASEVLAEKTIKQSGEDYLSATNNILAKTTCS